MLRHLTRSAPVWSAGSPIPGAGVLRRDHPRTRKLLGFWWAGNAGTRTTRVDQATGVAPVFMPDFSPYNRPAVFNPGLVGNRSGGAWSYDRKETGFRIIHLGGGGSQYGRLDVAPRLTNDDWLFAAGTLTFMCRVRMDTLTTSGDNIRVFVGRTDGAGGLNSKWYFAHEAGGARRLFFQNDLGGGAVEAPASTVGYSWVQGDTHTVAVTRSAAREFRFFADGVQLGTPVTGANNLVNPTSKILSWGYGQDFGRMLPGTFMWMKVWDRVLTPDEVAAEYRQPYEMVDWVFTQASSFGRSPVIIVIPPDPDLPPEGDGPVIITPELPPVPGGSPVNTDALLHYPDTGEVEVIDRWTPKSRRSRRAPGTGR